MGQDEQAAAIAAAWQAPERRLAAWPGTPPRDPAEGYRLQRAVAARLGPVGGWKVGASGPEAPPSCAPMPLSGMRRGPATVSLRLHPRPMVESEICLRLGRDLPPRATPYGEAEVLDAVQSCHPALEILQSRFLDDGALDPAARLADLLGHGGFVSGGAIEGWRDLDFASLGVVQQVEDQPDIAGRGNPAGGMGRLLRWLADEGAREAGGLHAGQFVTCGSWTGKTAVAAPARVSVRFERAPGLHVWFEA
jgi:2-keto-4-pentenoate hydratase